MFARMRTVLALAALLACVPTLSAAAERVVRDRAELDAAARRAQPGDRILIAPGEYPAAYIVARGLPGRPIEIAALDPSRPPVFSGTIYAPGCAWLSFRNLAMRGAGGASFNAINADDSGGRGGAVGLVFENVSFHVEDGNALKLAGVDDFTIRSCRFDAWRGTAVALVGCRRGLIEDCRFETQQPADHGVQIKGGSSDVVVRGCSFSGPAARWINIGGATSRDLMRPRDAAYEASRVLVERNSIRGGRTAIAFDTADASTASSNTIEDPELFVFRIVHSQPFQPGFSGCRNGRIENNRVSYDSGVIGAIFHLGFGADWRSFRLTGNIWRDRSGKMPPRWPGWLRWLTPSLADLPAPETDGSYSAPSPPE